MLFQALDEKEECIGVYCEGNIIKGLPEGLTHTWKYSSFLKDKPVEYANIYCAGKSLENVCPPHLIQEYDEIWLKLKAFYKSFMLAKISLQDHCFFDLVPEGFLRDFCSLKNEITKHVFETYEKPQNYEILKSIVQLTTDIKYQRLNIDLNCLKEDLANKRVLDFYRKMRKTEPYIKYNPFGTKTGRLTTEKHSFPILTMDKNFRKILKPNNDWFLEFDYNAAELRVMLGLSGEQQPTEDIHDWNINNVFKEEMDRESAKKRIFSWLYNPNSEDKVLEQIYNREKVKNRFWDGNHVKTIFDREIIADEYHALNYIIQSTCSDLIMQKATNIDKILQNKKTKVAFVIHDSIVLDYCDEDAGIVNKIYREFRDTPFGQFKANAAAGRNFGELKDLWIQ